VRKVIAETCVVLDWFSQLLLGTWYIHEANLSFYVLKMTTSSSSLELLQHTFVTKIATNDMILKRNNEKAGRVFVFEKVDRNLMDLACELNNLMNRKLTSRVERNTKQKVVKRCHFLKAVYFPITCKRYKKLSTIRESFRRRTRYLSQYHAKSWTEGTKSGRFDYHIFRFNLVFPGRRNPLVV